VAASIRIAIVGMGHIGATHIRVLGEFPEFLLVAGCDEDASHARLLEAYGIRRGRPTPSFFESHGELLKRTDADTIVVATPNSTHMRIARDCLSRGFNVVLEKPACRNAEEMRLLNATATAHDRHLYYALHAAFGREVSWAKQFLDSRQGGDPPVTGMVSVFSDSYLDDAGGVVSHALGLDDCWSDSAINALSVMDRFVDLDGVRPVCVEDVRYSSSPRRCINMKTTYATLSPFKPDGVKLSVHTCWDSSPGVKLTQLFLGDEKHCLVMDHVRQTVSESDGGTGQARVLAGFSGDRLFNHYEGVLRDYLRCRESGVMNTETASRVHAQAFAIGGHSQAVPHPLPQLRRAA
jgi:predicted dehydrogenase